MEEKTVIELLYQLKRIADSLERLANDGEPSPNLERPISEFKTFDWSSIDASVVQSDKDGPTHVEWNGMIWTRRSPTNKYEPAIWFSRSAGKDDNGDTRYLRLITFKTVKSADPLPEKAVEAAALKGYKETAAAMPAAHSEAKTTIPATEKKNLDNGVSRPYSPEVLKEKIAKRMELKAGKPCTPEQRNLATQMLNLCFAGEVDIELARKTVQDYLFDGIVSMDRVKPEFVLAILDWLDVKQDSGGSLSPSLMAIKEAKLVWQENRL